MFYVSRYRNRVICLQGSQRQQAVGAIKKGETMDPTILRELLIGIAVLGGLATSVERA